MGLRGRRATSLWQSVNVAVSERGIEQRPAAIGVGRVPDRRPSEAKATARRAAQRGQEAPGMRKVGRRGGQRAGIRCQDFNSK